MKNIICFLCLFPFFIFSQFEGNQTPTYPKLVKFYDSLSKLHQVELYNMGTSDYGLPIYICVLNGEKDSLKTFQKSRTGGTIFVNNGIHPGEPDGINACGKLTLDYVQKNLKIDKNIMFAFVLCYNLDGMMIRGAYSRANQNGPEEYGFRGNAQNLDLNRDFIKMDSKNAVTFVKIFQALKPSIFIDTHVSNGADYQYTLTLISSLKERLSPAMRKITYEKFIPDLEKELKKQKVDLFPYVELVNKTPDFGIEAFNDLPRYAMGYASLYPCISITTETHMLKAFDQRVKATYLYLKEVIYWTGKNKQELQKSILESQIYEQNKKFFQFNFVRTDKQDSILFKGFQYDYKKSEVTALDRLYYDRTKPYEKFIPFYKTYKNTDSVAIPKFYLLGSQCSKVIDKLKENQVEFTILKNDTVMKVSLLRVKSFDSPKKPYEGHFLHSNVQVAEEQANLSFKKGDLLIPTAQYAKTFLLSVLEPEAEDSYFAWNFFDSYLQEKEYFSDYVFEDLAVEILKENENLKKQFEEKKLTDLKFAASQWEQLYFIYQHSKYFESSFMRLPVFKVY